MSPEKALDLAHPGAIVLTIMDRYVESSKDYMFAKESRFAMVALPLIKKMNKAIGLDAGELSVNLHQLSNYYHSQFHQFEGPHAELSMEKLGECMNFSGDSESVGEMAAGWLHEICEDKSELMELYAPAVAYAISRHVHTNTQSSYILASLAG